MAFFEREPAQLLLKLTSLVEAIVGVLNDVERVDHDLCLRQAPLDALAEPLLHIDADFANLLAHLRRNPHQEGLERPTSIIRQQ